jgi:hypothetical protein
MKCIKTIKEAKSYTLGEIRRVTDIEADERVKGGYWKFVPKSEWKESKGKIKNNQVTEGAIEQEDGQPKARRGKRSDKK